MKINNDIFNYNKNEIQKIELNKDNEEIKSIKNRKNELKEKSNSVQHFKLNKNINTNINMNNPNLISLKEEDRLMNKCIFSNMEIKKFINDKDKIKSDKYNSQKKINNINNNILIVDNNKNKDNIFTINNNKSLNKKNFNPKFDRIALSANKNKKELKEESTNTYSNLFLKDIKDSRLSKEVYNITLRNESNSQLYNGNNIKTRNNTINYNLTSKENIKIYNQNNKNYLSERNIHISNTDKNVSNNTISKTNIFRDIAIDSSKMGNNNNPNDIIKNNYKHYANIYNYLSMRSQCFRTNTMNNMNFNLFPFYFLNNNNNNSRNIINNNNELIINSFFNNINVNSFSLRELYRNINNGKYSSHSHLSNKLKNKNSSKKKKIKKSFKIKLNNINDNKYNLINRFKLTNLQYDNEIEKNEYKKRNNNLNIYKNKKNQKKDEYQYQNLKEKKIIVLCIENMAKKKVKIILKMIYWKLD